MTETMAQAPRNSLEHPIGAFRSPFLHAPEGVSTVFGVTFAAAAMCLMAGLFFFGWRAGMVAALSIGGCAIFEHLYFRVTHTPALLGRSHAYLTGMLLALTLPAYVPWYIPIVAAAFAIIVGKGVFGGVGHFLWQPALVGRLAVTVLFQGVLLGPAADLDDMGPVLAQRHVLTGDITDVQLVEDFHSWQQHPPPRGADAFLIERPEEILGGLTTDDVPRFAALGRPDPNELVEHPTLVLEMQPVNELFYGARPGDIGQTCILVIFVAGLYLIYRNYVKLILPLSFILAAAAVAAVAPVNFISAGGVETRWLPLTVEGLDVGMLYVTFQIATGGIVLAAFFFATETTSRPVTTGGQFIFGTGCGILAMFLKMFTELPIPAYLAVLAMNTLTPLIDAVWRPRVLGQPHFAWLRVRIGR